MKKAGLFLSSLLLTCVAATAETYRIPVGEFNELKVNDNVNVVYSNNPDSLGLVVFDIKNEYASYILTDINKGKLKIQLAQEAAGIVMPTIYVYSSFLSAVENTKSGDILIKGVKPTARFTAETNGNGSIVIKQVEATTLDLKNITGKGRIVAAGKCNNLNIKNIGTGDIDAMEVTAETVKTNILGTGSAYTTAVKSLYISGMGSGKVYYKGNPIITKSKLGNIKPVPVVNDAEVVTEEVVEEIDNNAVEESDEQDGGRKKVTTAEF